MEGPSEGSPLNLEHAIGCNVGFKNICHLHPNGRDYVKAVGGVVIVGSVLDPHEQTFLHGHDDFVTCLAVSHDGSMAASGQQGDRADVILWDLASRRQICRFEEQDHGIDCLCFSFDDRFLFTAGDAVDKRVFVYDVQTNLIIAWATLQPAPTLSVMSGGMVRDIKRRDTHEYQFAVCGGKTLGLWHLDAASGQLAPQAIGSAGKQTREYTCVAFSSDFEYLFAGSTTGDVGVVLMKNRVLQQYIPCCSGGVTTMVVIPTRNFTRVAIGGGDGSVTILSGQSPVDLREERQVQLDGSLTSLSLSGSSAELMAVSSQGTGFSLLTKDLAVKIHNQVCSGALYDVAYVAGSNDLFLTCCGDGLVTLWDANSYSARVRCAARTPRTHPISVCATQDIIVAGCHDGRLVSFACQEGKQLWQIDNAHKGGATSVKLASNCRFALSGGAEGDLRIWELKTREMVAHLQEHKSRVNEVQLFPNDEYAVSCSRDRCLLTWDLRQQKRLTAHRERHGGINCLAVSAVNQTMIYTAGQERQLTYWDVRMAEAAAVFPMSEEIQSISLHPSDRYLGMAGNGLVVKVWDVTAGKLVSECPGHSRAIQKVAFSTDGKQLVSVGHDHAALVWNFFLEK